MPISAASHTPLRPEIESLIAQAETLFRDKGDPTAALERLRHVLHLDPRHPRAHVMCAWVYRAWGAHGEAERHLRSAMEWGDLSPDTLFDLAVCLQAQGRDNLAIAAFHHVLAVAPDHRQGLACLNHLKLCCADWDGLDALTARMDEHEQAGRPLLPFRFNSVFDDRKRQKANAERWWKGRLDWHGARPSPLPVTPCRELPVLNVGYLSSDFHTHATAMLCAEMFKLHDRSRFRVFVYSCGPDDGGALRRRIQNGADVFRDMAQDADARIADQIKADRIHILVDMKGFTAAARFGVLMQRPAPALVHYLGYPGTLGGAVDYLIADHHVVPDDHLEDYSETVIRLPGSYQINDRLRPYHPPLPRAAYGLPQDAFVFCCFNQTYKLTPAVFAVWMRLLARIPRSVLWLYAPNGQARKNLAQHAAHHGINPNRLIFAGHLEQAAHLARLGAADLFLDSFPVTAHTTASDCLWAGCPLVTIRGQSFIARVAAGLLDCLGLSWLAADDLDQYEAIAHWLATQPRAMEAARAHLNQGARGGSLFDTPRTVRDLEAAYERIWDQCCSRVARNRTSG